MNPLVVFLKYHLRPLLDLILLTRFHGTAMELAGEVYDGPTHPSYLNSRQRHLLYVLERQGVVERAMNYGTDQVEWFWVTSRRSADWIRRHGRIDRALWCVKHPFKRSKLKVSYENGEPVISIK